MTSVSISEVLVKLGLRLAGGNHARATQNHGVWNRHHALSGETRQQWGAASRPTKGAAARAACD
jgi:hypothetical protein